MVTLSSISKKSKNSSASRMARAVRLSGGSFDQLLKAACALRKISSIPFSVFRLLTQVAGHLHKGQRELVTQIVKPVVDGRCRQHQHLGFNPFPNHLVHQLLIAGFFLFVGVVVAEVVRFIDYD